MGRNKGKIRSEVIKEYKGNHPDDVGFKDYTLNHLIENSSAYDSERAKKVYQENIDLSKLVYSVRKRNIRIWDKRAFKDNYDAVQKPFVDGCVDFPQGRSFWWHSAKIKGAKYIERFTLDLLQDSPDYPKVIADLDKFIVKHKASFKFLTEYGRNRSDTMNLYMCDKITPGIAAELYKIVKPVLNEGNHNRLDGVEIVSGGKVVKGLKYGPETSDAPKQGIGASENTETILRRDFGRKYNYFLNNSEYFRTDTELSLGEFNACLETLELLYYIFDKGKCPFDMANRYGPAPDARTAKEWGYIRDSYDTMDITEAIQKKTVEKIYSFGKGVLYDFDPRELKDEEFKAEIKEYANVSLLLNKCLQTEGKDDLAFCVSLRDGQPSLLLLNQDEYGDYRKHISNLGKVNLLIKDNLGYDKDSFGHYNLTQDSFKITLNSFGAYDALKKSALEMFPQAKSDIENLNLLSVNNNTAQKAFILKKSDGYSA